MAEVKLMVLYPHPTDVEQFDSDYQEHIKLLREKANIPEDVHPYTVTRLQSPGGEASFYQLFTMPFPSGEALQQAMGTTEMQEVAADAVRISTGGAPVILIGSDAA